MTDNVNHPAHYETGKFECIEVMLETQGVDMVKKYRFQGHELDKAHLAKELGDVAWYIAVAAHAIGYDLETVLQMNVDKLRNRYPNGFEKERSLHRQEGDV